MHSGDRIKRAAGQQNYPGIHGHDEEYIVSFLDSFLD